MSTRISFTSAFVIGLGIIALAVTPMTRTGTERGNADRGNETGDAEHGRYIVEQVAMCIQCHSPRDEQGEIIESQRLMGAAIPFISPFRRQPWASTAPRIAGLPQYTLEAGIKLLTSGMSRTGNRPMPPMPPFRMSEQDARDVIVYLKSLR